MILDRVIACLFAITVFLAKHARKMPWIKYDQWKPGKPLKILLAGYNGAANTGAELRTDAIIRQLNDIFGSDRICFEVLSIDADYSSSVFSPFSNVRVIQVSTTPFLALLKACSDCHCVIIAEGSMLKSKFANALTLYLCAAAGMAKMQRKPCVAYGIEAGDMDPFIERWAKRFCGDALIISRSSGTSNRLESLELDCQEGTDCAWYLEPSRLTSQMRELLLESGWDQTSPLAGIAPINPFYWPAKPSIGRYLKSQFTRKWDMHYQGLFFLTWSEERKQSYDRYMDSMLGTVNSFLENDCFPVVIGMEALDRQACEDLSRRIQSQHCVITVNDAGPRNIDSVLCSLSYLTTSRYHAAVLSMRAGLSPVAVSMDERLKNLYEDFDLIRDQFYSVDDPQLGARLVASINDLFNEADDRADCSDPVKSNRQILNEMADLLVSHLHTYGISIMPHHLKDVSRNTSVDESIGFMGSYWRSHEVA